MDRYICLTDGFRKSGVIQDNPVIVKKINIHSGEVVDCDERGMFFKNNVFICHRDSILGKQHFRKIEPFHITDILWDSKNVDLPDCLDIAKEELLESGEELKSVSEEVLKKRIENYLSVKYENCIYSYSVAS